MSVALFTLAVNRKYKNKETNQYDADFIRCKAFKNTADFLSKYVTKGQEILVEGTIKTGKYQDGNGTTHYTTDVMIENVEFVGSKKDNGAAQTTQSVDIGDLGEFEEILSDEPPF